MQRLSLRRWLSLILFVGSLTPGHAQITLSTAYFPEVGDSLLTNQASEEYEDGITFQPAGENLTWDFGTPDMRYEFTEVLESVTNDTFFLDAEARLSSAAFAYEYYQRTDTSYNLVGLVGTLPFLRDTVLATRISPPRPIKRAGVTYGDRFASTSVRELRMHVDSLPAEIREGAAGSLLGLYDSLRVVNTSVRNDEMDAYGTLRLNGKDYEVLREKRVEQLETRVYLKQGANDYDDFTSLIMTFDASSGQYLGQQPEEGTYYFWAQGVKEPIVEIEFDEDENPTTFLYIRGERTSTSVREDDGVRDVLIQPNPVSGALTVTYDLVQPGQVHSTLYDSNGRRVRQWTPSTVASGPQQLEIEVTDLPAGIYFFELKSHTGRTMRKLVKQ